MQALLTNLDKYIGARVEPCFNDGHGRLAAPCSQDEVMMNSMMHFAANHLTVLHDCHDIRM